MDTPGIAISKLPKESKGIQSLNMQLRGDEWLDRIALSVPLEGSDENDLEAACEFRCWPRILQ